VAPADFKIAEAPSVCPQSTTPLIIATREASTPNSFTEYFVIEKTVSTLKARSNSCSKHRGATIRSTMATSSSETTPLLADTTPVVETHDATLNAPTTSNDEASLPASAHFPRTRKMLSILILVVSPITVILLIPLRILVVDLGSFGYLDQDLLFYTKTLIFLVCSL
jgi:hypothetical protein